MENEVMKDSETLLETRGNQASVVSWNPGVEHLEKGLVLSRDQSKKGRMRPGDVIGN